MNEHWDYVIVGAGSAGCVLANRLSADPGTRVLLVEAGGEDRHPAIPIPMGIGRTLLDPDLCWYYQTEPDDGNAGEPRIWMRGRVLGGSSSINGMMYCRGQPEDYDGWVARGARGWGWEAMSRAFRAIEDHELGDDGVRGAGGPLHVSVRSPRTPLTEAVLDAAQDLGLRRREDVNRPDQEGIGYTPRTIRNGRRVSAADAFLAPARARPNLRVVTRTEVQRLLFDGARAIGIAGRGPGGEVEFRGREIIVSCGTINTPKLLMLSGIGAGAALHELGIPVRADLPGVGRNLREHKTISMQLRLARDLSLNRQFSGWRLGLNLLRYALTRAGPLASTYDINGFLRTQPGLSQPDAQLTIWTLSFDKRADTFGLESFPGLMAMGYPLRTQSEGGIRLRSPDPAAAPIIQTRFLEAEHDRRVTIGLFRFMRRLFAHPRVAGFVAAETHPGAEIDSDAAILDAARRDQTCQHAVGTCRMGEDALAVLDARLRVRGIQGLRVMDLSAMPTQVSGNTNGPVMAMAWRAADLILEDTPPLKKGTFIIFAPAA
ncbi:MAG: GMC family oxidoreductase [Gammaproteobacteria bacterium]